MDALSLSDFSHKKPLVKELATTQDFDYLPLHRSDGGLIGYAISNDRFKAYQQTQEKRETSRPVIFSKAHEEAHHHKFGFDDKSNPQAVVICFGQWAHKPAATMVIVSEELYKEISSTLADREIKPFAGLNGLKKVTTHRTQTHADNVQGDARILGIDFLHKTGVVTDQVDGGYLVTRRDSKVAAVTNEWALKLKERTHNGSADVIKDIPVGDVNRLKEDDIAPVAAGEQFIRVTRHDAHGQKRDERFTIISTDLAEYFTLDKSGKITSLVEDIGFTYDFEFDAVIKSNFAETTKIRLVLEERQNRTLLGRHVASGQSQIIQRTLEKLYATQRAVAIAGMPFKVTDQAPFVKKDVGKFALTADSKLSMRVNLSSTREAEGLQLAFNGQSSMVGMAASVTNETIFQVNDMQFRLAPMR